MADDQDDLIADQDPQSAAAAQGLSQLAKSQLDNGPQPQPGSDAYASGQAEPEASPIDLIAAEAIPVAGTIGEGAFLAARDAFAEAPEILGNEIGSIGSRIPKGPKLPASQAGFTDQAAAAKQLVDNPANSQAQAVSSGQRQGAVMSRPPTIPEGHFRPMRRKMAGGGDPVDPLPAYAPIPANDAAPDSSQAAPAAAAPSVGDNNTTNVISPTGEMASVPNDQLQNALHPAYGYRIATPEDVAHYQKVQKYGTPSERLNTVIDSAVRNTTFGAVPGFGKPEDIAGRQEANPGLTMGGAALGLAGSMYTGVGEGAIAEELGTAAKAALGLGGQGAGVISKIGGAAVKGAIENGAIQAGDENSRMVLSGDRSQEAVEHAAIDVGLAGLIGGGIGGVAGSISPLWSATVGKKTGTILNAVTEKLGGREGAISSATDQLIAKTGIDVAPEIRASLSDIPQLQEQASILNQTDNRTGLQYQTARKGFNKAAGDAVVQAFGKSPDEIPALTELSENATGKSITDNLHSRLSQEYAPIKAAYEDISNKFSPHDVPDAAKAAMTEKVGQIINTAGSPTSPASKLAQRVLSEIPGIKTLEDLRNYEVGLGAETRGIANQHLWPMGRALRTVLQDGQDSVLSEAVAEKAPELIEKHNATRAAYGRLKQTISDLNDRLHVGDSNGPATFLKSLKDMDGEDVLRRLSPKGRADIINELGTKFPEVAQQVKDYHINKMLKTAADRAAPGETINPNTVASTLRGMSPEMRAFVGSPETLSKISAVSDLLEKLNSGSPHNWSNSARVAAKLLQDLPGAAVGMVSMLLTHNPAIAVLLGGLTKTIGKDIPDAVRLGLLKFLGSQENISPSAFKSATEMIQSTLKGANLAGRATKNLFKAGAEVIPQSFLPNEKDRARLDKMLKKVQKNPDLLQDAGKSVGHYMPEHGGLMGALATQGSSYLNSLRPEAGRAGMLDSPVKPTTAQTYAYNNALDIAQQPLIVLDKIQKGTLTPQDIQHLSAMYPSLQQSLQTKLFSQIAELGSKGQSVPYKTRIGLSLFLGQPLDSTMTPAGIMAAQPMPQTPQQAPQGAPKKKGTSALSKYSQPYQTASQAAESDRSDRS